MEVETLEHDEAMMGKALLLAREAMALDEVPVGALIVAHGNWIGEGYNCNIETHDPTAHAEISALRKACSYLGNHRIPEACIYVTLEPCPMCFHALVQARVKRIVIGASDPKGGFSQFFSQEDRIRMNHVPEIQFGVLESLCSQLITDFFNTKRNRGKRKWLRAHPKD